VAIEDALKDLEPRLASAASEHGVVGAAMAVAVGDHVADEAATGVASLRTGAPVTPDTLFQIGSITKVWTGTLVMQLVDEGLLDLDKPVQALLPEFLLADPDVASAVSVRQLLAHTGGFEGDVLDDFGRGDDAIEQYLAALASKAQVHPPGAMFSYCNAGFVVLGRLVERLRGAPYNTTLRSRLIAPLGLEATATSADEAILRPAAVGHVPEPGGEEGKHMVAPVWSLGRAMDPAGAQLACAARDLAAFALVHLNDGKATDGTQVLSSESVAAMQQQQVATPGPADPVLGRGVGLPWILTRGEGPAVIGHDGGTIGQYAFLRVVPSEGLAVVLLTNGGKDPLGLFREMVGDLLYRAAGITIPPSPRPPDPPVPFEPRRYAGVYERESTRLELAEEGDGLQMSVAHTGRAAELGLPVPPTRRLVGFDADSLITADPLPQSDERTTLTFLGDDGSGHPRYLHMGGRATPRRG